jgi:hypothetical protein
MKANGLWVWAGKDPSLSGEEQYPCNWDKCNQHRLFHSVLFHTITAFQERLFHPCYLLDFTTKSVKIYSSFIYQYCIILGYLKTLLPPHRFRSVPLYSEGWHWIVKSKGKVIPVTGRGGPWGCKTSRLPHFLDNRLTDGGEVVSLTRWSPIYPHPRKIPDTHFC